MDYEKILKTLKLCLKEAKNDVKLLENTILSLCNLKAKRLKRTLPQPSYYTCVFFSTCIEHKKKWRGRIKGKNAKRFPYRETAIEAATDIADHLGVTVESLRKPMRITRTIPKAESEGKWLSGKDIGVTPARESNSTEFNI